MGYGKGHFYWASSHWAWSWKASKILIKGFNKQLKSMPNAPSKQVKAGLSSVTKTNMKDAVTHTAKEVVEQSITYELGKVEKEILTIILNSIKDEVKKGVFEDVKITMEKESPAKLVDIVNLSQLGSEEQLNDLLKDKNRKNSWTFLECWEKLHLSLSMQTSVGRKSLTCPCPQ